MALTRVARVSWLESVGAGLKGGGAFLNHCLVDEKAQALGKAKGAFIGEELQNGGQRIRVNLVGHMCFMLDVFGYMPPETKLARSP